jgi:nitrogen PTS system EIIA component
MGGKMDLKIKDVADLLNVSERTIRRWLIEGKIPAYRLNGQYRFSRIEIENWVMSCKTAKEKEEPKEMQEEMEKISLNSKRAQTIVGNQIGTQAYSLFRAIYKGGVLHNVKGKNKEDVIKNSVQILAKNLNLDEEALVDLLMDREKLMPTGLNHGIGVPHTRDFLFLKPFDIITVVFPETPIEYGSLDGKKVHTLFFLFAGDEKKHLHLLAKLAHFTSSEETLQYLQEKPMKTDLLNYVKKFEANLCMKVEETNSHILQTH